MIKKNNIGAYIDFLYRRRTQHPTPFEVINSWTTVEEMDIQTNLSQLYKSWQISELEGKKLEREFLNSTAPPESVNKAVQATASLNTPIYVPEVVVDRFKGIKKILTAGIVISLIIAGIQYISINNQTDETVVTAQADPTELLPTRRADETVNEGTMAALVDPNDETNQQQITNFLNTECRQEINDIYGFMSQNIESFAGIQYPTYEEFYNYYTSYWNGTSNPSYSNVQIDKSGENTYSVKCTYNYFDISSDTNIQKKQKLEFVFDDENKIIQFKKL